MRQEKVKVGRCLMKSGKVVLFFLMCGASFAPVCLQSAEQVKASIDCSAEITKLKEAKLKAKMFARIAGSQADNLLTRSYFSYLLALERQESYQHQAKMLDEKIIELSKQK